MKINKILCGAFLFLASSFLFGATARYQDENYTIDVQYNDEVSAGDAIFVRMTLETPKNHKKLKSESERKATLQFYQDKKLLETAPFYSVAKKKSSTFSEMLCGVPVSLWATENTYSLKVIFSLSEGEDAKEFTLPVKFIEKEWNKETIELDSKNTDIKTDNSPERAAQIEKLNNILFTTMTSDIYALKPFTCPTTSTRYTAYCGDRRIYAYVNGKSSTSLHYGNDYGIPTGSEVHACAEGKVVLAEWRISTGYSVVIEHLPGLYSLYYHCSELNVKEGQMVKQDELIAKSGATGLATGPHLHWEMRLNGSAVVPEFFMKDFTFSE